MIKSDSVKRKIKNISQKSGIRPQDLLQMFMFEQFLIKLSQSKYKHNFILKGGFYCQKYSEKITEQQEILIQQ